MFWGEAPLRIDQLYNSEGVSLYIPNPIFAANPITGPHSLRRLRLGNLDDLRLVDDPEMKNWPQYTDKRRLNEFIRFNWGPNNTTVYIVDHHHFALYGWAESIKEGKIAPGAFLRHFDDHSDAGEVDHIDFMTKKEFRQKKWNLKEVLEGVKVIGCWQFIMPAKRMGLIDKFIHIKAGNNLMVGHNGEYTEMSIRSYREKRPRYGKRKYEIVDIDLDYFVSAELDPNQEEADVQTMRQDILSAGVATLAISPGFINPEKAIHLIKRILA